MGRVVVWPVLAWCNFGLLLHQREDAVQFARTIAEVRSREMPGANVLEVLLSTDASRYQCYARTTSLCSVRVPQREKARIFFLWNRNACKKPICWSSKVMHVSQCHCSQGVYELVVDKRADKRFPEQYA